MLPYQLAVASRAIAAILGCYGLASAAAACLAVGCRWRGPTPW